MTEVNSAWLSLHRYNNEYQPMGGEVLQLGNTGSLRQVWLVFVGGGLNCVIPSVTLVITKHLKVHLHFGAFTKCYPNPRTVYFNLLYLTILL